MRWMMVAELQGLIMMKEMMTTMMSDVCFNLGLNGILQEIHFFGLL